MINRVYCGKPMVIFIAPRGASATRGAQRGFDLNADGLATKVKCYMTISQKQLYKANSDKLNDNPAGEDSSPRPQGPILIS
jgi:hypothetical protein